MSSIAQRWDSIKSLFLGTTPQEGLDALPVRVHGNEFSRTPAMPVSIKGFDQPLLWAIFTLLVFGLIMVYSASIAMQDNPRFNGNYSQTHYLIRHVISLSIAFMVGLLAFQVSIDNWEKAAPWFFISSLVLTFPLIQPAMFFTFIFSNNGSGISFSIIISGM